MPKKYTDIHIPGVEVSVDDLAAAVGEYVENLLEVAGDVLVEIGNEILTDAKDNYVPEDSGNLLRSGFVDDPTVTDNGVELVIGFGGAAAAYAAAVHEHPSAISAPSWIAKEGRGEQIQWSQPGRGPKYLQIPFFERVSRIPGDLADGIRRRLP